LTTISKPAAASLSITIQARSLLDLHVVRRDLEAGSDQELDDDLGEDLRVAHVDRAGVGIEEVCQRFHCGDFASVHWVAPAPKGRSRSHLEVGRARTADKIVRPMMDRPPAGPQRLVRDLPAAASEQVDSARIFACHKPEARDAAHQTMTLSNSCIAVAIRASSEPPWAGGKLSLLAGRGRAWGTEMPINRLLANSELGPDAIYLCEGDPKLAYAIFLRIALARAHWRRRTAFVILFFW